MRGSPLLKTLCLIVLLALVGLGFSHLLHQSPSNSEPSSDLSKAPAQAEKRATFYLSFSHPTHSFELMLGEKILRLSPENEGTFSGEASITKNLPVFLKAAPTSKLLKTDRYFAKLVIEAQGEPTFTKIFDAEEKIDDFLELPF